MKVKPTWRLLVTLVGLVVVIPAIIFAMLTVYDTIWMSVSDQPFTWTMRDYPWLFPVLGVPLVVLLGWRIPFMWWGRAVLMAAVWGYGIIGGHVYW